MELVLVAKQNDGYRSDFLMMAWNHCFQMESKVKVIQGDILDFEADAIVSPANSFGFMDGGIDAAYIKRFGSGVQDTLQKEINNSYMGELLVGQSIVIPTGDERIPNLISSPTMRIGMEVRNTVNAYLATKSSLIHARENGFKSVLMPGMCTGTGRMDPFIAAHQMYLGYMHVTQNNKVFRHFYEACDYHKELTGEKYIKK